MWVNKKTEMEQQLSPEFTEQIYDGGIMMRDLNGVCNRPAAIKCCDPCFKKILCLNEGSVAYQLFMVKLQTRKI